MDRLRQNIAQAISEFIPLNRCCGSRPASLVHFSV
jgi:hypothetical protein